MKFNINNMKTSITIVLLSLSATIATGQNDNLVSNGSFESVDKEPKKLGSIENAMGWYSPTGAKADLFTPNKKLPIINVPSNQFGSENAKDGSNYAGIVTFSHNNKVPRSYVSNKLEVPLKKGEKYCVQFHISLAEASAYASNQIGVHFSNKAFASAAKDNIITTTHILEESNKIFSAPFGWDRVCGTFIAEGGEKFITIGNFTSNEHTKNIKVKKDSKNKVPPVAAAYYYLDDISVILLDEDNTCDCASTDPTEGFSKTVYQKAINLTGDMDPAKKIESLQVFFGFGKTDLTNAGTEALDMIVEIMKQKPGYKLQINGYSDGIEDAAAEDQPFFQGMDSKRTNEVFNYLKSKGIGEHRMIASPQGSDEQSAEIVESDDDDIKQAKNRRVEFKIRQ